MSVSLPASILDCFSLAHTSWHPGLRAGLEAMLRTDPDYVLELAHSDYLPSNGRLLAAFGQPLDAVRYVLIGEGPYPRAESATGVCFMDGAVQALWSEKGLSKRVNRATSLRNFMKMLLVADGRLSPALTTGEALAHVSRNAGVDMIQSLAELQDNLHRQGFLLLNATLVYREHVSLTRESRAWEPFLRVVLQTLLQAASLHGKPPPALVLWGKIAERLAAMPEARPFPQWIAEHPYNLSFIASSAMHELFAPMRLLNKMM